ncbi:MAG: ATP-dependent helicase, partial [Proteobacteria bacterium]|nr:ATP-dependent helicase [Pseudomonadota bacterium]
RGEGRSDRGRPRREGPRPEREAREPREARAPREPREPRDVPSHRPHSFAPQQPKSQDPIFSKPYEPGTGAPAPATATPSAQSGPRRARPVAALLGGLKRA